jgi:hypothetical protein
MEKHHENNSKQKENKMEYDNEEEIKTGMAKTMLIVVSLLCGLGVYLYFNIVWISIVTAIAYPAISGPIVFICSKWRKVANKNAKDWSPTVRIALGAVWPITLVLVVVVYLFLFIINWEYNKGK